MIRRDSLSQGRVVTLKTERLPARRSLTTCALIRFCTPRRCAAASGEYCVAEGPHWTGVFEKTRTQTRNKMKPKPRTRANIQPNEASLGNLFMRSTRKAVAKMEPTSRTMYLVMSFAICTPFERGFHHGLIEVQRARQQLTPQRRSPARCLCLCAAPRECPLAAVPCSASPRAARGPGGRRSLPPAAARASRCLPRSGAWSLARSGCSAEVDDMAVGLEPAQLLPDPPGQDLVVPNRDAEGPH